MTVEITEELAQRIINNYVADNGCSLTNAVEILVCAGASQIEEYSGHDYKKDNRNDPRGQG